MIKTIFFFTALTASLSMSAQTYKERVQQYILQYKDLAQAEQKRSGIPAAITLGQGILETEAGRSELATMANNHFGIKCKKEWTGETFAHDDDAPQECFRKYPTALQSYKDHSDYLKCSKRYQSCFAQSLTDYSTWAKELRRCGYATNPKYARVLIKIIEDFQLQDYTYAAMSSEEPVLIASAASPVAAVIMTEKAAGEVVPDHDTPAAGDDTPVYGQVVHKDGLKGIYARKGDVLLEYAIQYKVRYAKLLEINGLPDAPLAADMFVYLEKGGKVSQIISRDASTPVVTYAAPARDMARAETTGIESAPPAPAGTEAVPVPLPVAIVSETNAAATETKPAAVATAAPETQPIKQPAVKSINIADEVAVEETKPAAEEAPQDEFSRLKARLDKVVYAPAVKSPQARATAPAAPVTEKPAALVPAAAAGGKVYHTVKGGETAFGIAKKYGISMKELMSMNGLNFEAIKIGQKLRVK